MLTTYPEALDYLYSRANWETRPPGTKPTFELDRIRRLLANLGDPHLQWPAVHVGGTNGKGSACAMIAEGLRSAGYRVGLYTSPHLHTLRERVRVDGELVSELEVVDWLNANRAALDSEPGLTTFEALTALAFSHFACHAVDVAVVEVGLGGTLDTTNVVRPVVSVLTQIGLDHTEVLGETIPQIAADKAGIIKPGVPVVSAPQSLAALAVIEARTAEAGSPLVLLGRDVDWHAEAGCVEPRPMTVSVRSIDGDRRHDFVVALGGLYQAENAAVAATTLDVLGLRGWSVSAAAIREGLARAQWPGRFERFGARPTVVVDGAHNVHGARALETSLTECYPDAPRCLIVGSSRDKAVGRLLEVLLPTAKWVYAAAAEHPRAMPPEDLAALIEAQGRQASAMESPEAALESAIDVAAPDGVVVATGSIFLAAQVRLECLRRRGLVLPPTDPPKE